MNVLIIALGLLIVVGLGWAGYKGINMLRATIKSEKARDADDRSPTRYFPGLLLGLIGCAGFIVTLFLWFLFVVAVFQGQV